MIWFRTIAKIQHCQNKTKNLQEFPRKPEAIIDNIMLIIDQKERTCRSIPAKPTGIKKENDISRLPKN